jgi:hypothetical protein
MRRVAHPGCFDFYESLLVCSHERFIPSSGNGQVYTPWAIDREEKQIVTNTTLNHYIRGETELTESNAIDIKKV